MKLLNVVRINFFKVNGEFLIIKIEFYKILVI